MRWAALLLLAGCGGRPVVVDPVPGDAGGDVATGAATVDAPTLEDDSAERLPALWAVDVYADGYDPPVTYARRGDAVEWRWRTTVPVSVTSGLPCLPDGMFSSGPRVRPATFRVRLPFAGPYLYGDALACDSVVGAVIVAP